MKTVSYVLFAAVLTAAPAIAGEPEVIDARATRAADGTYRFDVTVRHADEGWEHYADSWDVLDGKGTVLGTRVLLHPHEHEQPFTRSLSDVRVPSDVRTVTIRAHDKVHGNGSKVFALDLP